ncbi:NAD(P)-binding protein [Ophiobolus disseminans]|uniref:NAD(P)-binding protein n=1 Tax=Ophiobolus disseminans TaxID=1469910 RepID=A0A6A6ZMW6_9PLEO|nr:NAD(P)-binding protein [Ophiobolus disseminans]
MASSSGTVLLTGANGFVAAHIVQGLIERNYHIVGTVRSEKKAQDVIALHPSWKKHITWVYIADIGARGAYDDVFKTGPFDYIIHNASPVDFTVTDYQGAMVGPAVRGTTALLQTAQRLGGPLLKRVVLSGSTASVFDYFQPLSKAREPYTEADWSDVTVKYAIEKNDVVAAYLASKTLAEQGAWKFMETNKPTFDMIVLNPYVIIGPMLQPVAGPENVPSTNVFPVLNFLNGTYTDISTLGWPAWHFVDVRDVARAHILSMTTSAASNKRILLVSGLVTPQMVINIIRKNFPELHDRVIEGISEKLIPDGVEPTDWDVRRSYEVFGETWKYIELEKTIVDTVRDVLNHEKKWASG